MTEYLTRHTYSMFVLLNLFLCLSHDVAIIAGCLYTVQQCAGGGLRLPGASVWGMMVVVRVSRQP